MVKFFSNYYLTATTKIYASVLQVKILFYVFFNKLNELLTQTHIKVYMRPERFFKLSLKEPRNFFTSFSSPYSKQKI